MYEITDDGYIRADKEIAERQTAPAPPVISAKALEILNAGIAGQGSIMHRASIGAEGIHAGGKHFMTGNDPRGDAEWREALEELVAKALIVARSQALYQVTATGYRLAEELNQAAEQTA